MPRDYAKLLHSLWNNPDFLARTPEAQRLYMLIMSQPNLSHAGVIPLTVRRWATLAAGTTTDDILTALDELEETRFVITDHDTEEVFVRSYLRSDETLGNPNLAIAAARAYQQITSRSLRVAWLVELRRLYGEQDQQPSKAWHDARSGPLLVVLLGPIPEPPPPGVNNPSEPPSDDHTEGRTEPPSVPPSERGTEPPPEALPKGVSYAYARDVRARHARTSRAAPAPTPSPTTHSVGERSALATDTERHPENDTAGTLISEWIDHCPKRPPGTVIGQVGKHLKTMLAEGIDPDDLRRGLAAWHAKGLHPSTLPSVVNETMNTRPDQARALLAAVGADVIPMRPATGDIRAAANLALVEELRALEAAQEQP